jgi:hypothetical protein
MVFISRLWESVDVFFYALDHDLILWEAFLLSCWSFFVFFRNFYEVIISIITSLLLQFLKLSVHPRVLDSSTPNF